MHPRHTHLAQDVAGLLCHSPSFPPVVSALFVLLLHPYIFLSHSVSPVQHTLMACALLSFSLIIGHAFRPGWGFTLAATGVGSGVRAGVVGSGGDRTAWRLEVRCSQKKI